MKTLACLLATFAAGLLVPPATALASSLSVPRAVVLGNTESVDVTLHLAEAPGDEDRPLRAAVNVGTLEVPVRVGPGLYRALFRPPPEPFPQVALIALWREGGPQAPVEVLRLPLVGRTRVPIGATPGAELTVRLDDYTFGPVVVGPSGLVEVPLIVLPGVSEAEVLAKSREGTTTRRKVPVQVPEYNRLVAVAVPHALRPDGKTPVRIEVFHSALSSLSPQQVRVAASLGTVSLQESRPGHLTFAYVPPADPPVSTAELEVSLENDLASRATLSVDLLLPSPTRISLNLPQNPVPADGRTVVLAEIRLLDEQGLGLAGYPVRLEADGVPLPVTESGGGLYRAQFTTPLQLPSSRAVSFEASLRTGRVELLAHKQVKLLRSSVPATVRWQGALQPLPADGRAGPRLAFEVRDNAGRPVAGAPLKAAVSHGAVGPVEDKGGGRYEVGFRPPAELPPGGDVQVRITDAEGALDQTEAVPLRPDPGRLLLGLRVGYVHSLSAQHGPRVGLAATLRLCHLLLELGAGLSTAGQQVRSGELSSRSEAIVVPVSLRAGWELLASPHWSVTAGAGGVVAWARVANDLAGVGSHVGYGAMAFGSVARQLGPGQAFLDLSLAWAPVRGASFDLQAGGLALELGYRIRVF
ncbi:MAG: hypothetical protein QM765_05165 [Myxococcales bacterium]